MHQGGQSGHTLDEDGELLRVRADGRSRLGQDHRRWMGSARGVNKSDMRAYMGRI